MNTGNRAFDDYYSNLLARSIAEDELPPAILRRYRVDACLSASAQKRVYKLSGLLDARPYILKATSGDCGDSALREANLLETLNHPGIPKMVEYGEHGGWQYLVRQYMEGRTLDKLLAHGGPLPETEVLRIGREAAGIIDCLHRLEPPLIHRDIKPQNLIRTPQGAICLIDFGIAREFKQSLPHDTVALGSFGFAPPEQFGLSQTDPRSDIFSLGMLLYCLATGRRKGYTDSLADIRSPLLRAIIRRCTRLEARRRYRSARRLGAALAFAQLCGESGRQAAKAAAAALLLFAFAFPGSTNLPYIRNAAQKQAHLSEDAALRSGALADAARQSLGLAATEPLTPQRLSQVRSLTLSGDAAFGAEDMDQLRLFSNLSELTLTQMGIRDLAALRGLPLKRLELAGNSITSLEALKSIPTLERLGVAQNPVVDLSPLTALPALTSLDLSYTEIHQLDSLKQMTGLRHLDLRGCKATDMAPLSSLGQLQTLRLAYQQARDFSFLRQMADLRVLELRSTGFSDLSVLCCTRLETLDLSWNYNYMSEIADIARFSRLRDLDISYTGIRDLSPLADLPELRTLRLHDAGRELPQIPALERVVVTGEGNRAFWETVGRDQNLEIVTVSYPTIYQEATGG